MLADVDVLVKLHELAVEVVLQAVTHPLTELLKSRLAVFVLRATDFEVALKHAVDLPAAQPIDQHIVF